MGGGGGDPDGPVNTAQTKTQLRQAAVMGAVTSIAFSAGCAVVFSRMNDARDVCDASGASLYIYASLFLVRLWASCALSFLLFLSWNPQASPAQQAPIAKLLLQVSKARSRLP